MLNRFTVAGRLVNDPELRYTDSDIPVLSFRIACDRNYKSADGEFETDFFSVTAWRQKAEFIAKYFTKGQMICIDGVLQQRTYHDKDNNKRTVYEVVADHAHFCGSKSDNGTAENKNANSPQNTSNKTTSYQSDDFVPDFGDGYDIIPGDDDLPF